MQKAVLSTLAILGLPVSGITPTASAQCDISQTKCALNGGKCNIKFRNRTGDANGSDGGTPLDQTSSAQTIKVSARESDGSKAGNALSITAGASKTMNLEKTKKQDFQTIRIEVPANTQVRRAVMSCADVQAVLNGNGTCKVFHGETPTSWAEIEFALGYQCDGGAVAGASK